MALLLVLLLPAAAPARPGYATVLLYHRFGEPQYPSTNIAVEQFRNHLEYLRDGGYRVLSMEEFGHLLRRGEPFPPRSVLITIDDANRSVYDGAFPLLREFGYPFVFFANTSPLSSSSAAFVDWEMLAEMQRGGAAIGNHSHFHEHLGRPRQGQDRKAYGEWVRRDLQQARQALAARGVEAHFFAYPFGEYNEVVLEVVRELGFEFAFTQDEGGVDGRCDRLLIPRVAIVGANMDLERFAYKLSLAPLRVAGLEPAGFLLEENPPDAFSLRLEEPERYRSGVVNMFVSEWGRVEAVYDASSGRLSFRPGARLTRPFNRLIVTAREREGGQFSMFSRLYALPFAELEVEGE